MSAFIEDLDNSTKTLWIEYNKYAGNLLSGGSIPWLDVDQLIGWQRKAFGLLPSDVVSLPVSDVISLWLAKHGQLEEAMGAKRRVGYALRTLLADPGLRSHLVELSKGLRACFPTSTLALVVPSPAMWAIQAHGQAFAGEKLEPDLDVIDSASVYVADFLRGFAEAGIDVLLLEESTETEPKEAEVIDVYKPLFNLAEHYRWAIGIKVPRGDNLEALKGPDFWIAPHAVAGARIGVTTPPKFWSGEVRPERSTGGFIFVEVPAAEKPESVLERLATLR